MQDHTVRFGKSHHTSSEPQSHLWPSLVCWYIASRWSLICRIKFFVKLTERSYKSFIYIYTVYCKLLNHLEPNMACRFSKFSWYFGASLLERIRWNILQWEILKKLNSCILLCYWNIFLMLTAVLANVFTELAGLPTTRVILTWRTGVQGTISWLYNYQFEVLMYTFLLLL